MTDFLIGCTHFGHAGIILAAELARQNVPRGDSYCENGSNMVSSLKSWGNMFERINPRGHFCYTEDETLNVEDQEWTREVADFAAAAVTVSLGSSMMYPKTCFVCGETVRFHADDDVVTADAPCAYPGGIPDYGVQIGIFSGKMVFANDLRELTDTQIDLDLNSSAGRKAYTEAHAANGLALIFVGNSDPFVLRNDQGMSVEARSGEAVVLGRIVTGLWWYSAMDHDLFLSRCLTTGVSPEKFDAFVVDVAPGTYEFTDEQALIGEVAGSVYSKIRRLAI